jgi:soluble lytic murein transglycosylase-like protein
MEKRLNNAHVRTLTSAGGLAGKLCLVAILFVPAGMAATHLSRQEHKLARHRNILSASFAHTIEKPKPRDLVKIFSIVRAYRPDISDSEAWKVSDVILQESANHTLDPMLVLAVIEVESRFQYNMVSPVGARGIMQIMPDTAKSLAALDIGRQQGLRPDKFKPEFLDDPVLNIKLGVSYLHDLKKQFRNLNLALIAYNAGPTEIQNRLDNNIDLSDEYATLVLTAYQKNKKALPTF